MGIIGTAVLFALAMIVMPVLIVLSLSLMVSFWSCVADLTKRDGCWVLALFVAFFLIGLPTAILSGHQDQVQSIEHVDE